ncbi:MAG: hypothetical protein JWM82_3749, partial [Myxococcales bacterium]|nr:hypothetical protein [Myxococcales bacterium]
MTTAMTTGTTNTTGWTRRLRAGLVALPLLGAAVLLPACGSSPCYDGNIRATWSLKTPNGQTVECLAGDTVEMQVDTGDMTVSFPCGDHVGVSPAVAAGTTHAVSMALFDGNHQLLSHTDPLTVTVGCGGVVTTPPVEFPVDAP